MLDLSRLFSRFSLVRSRPRKDPSMIQVRLTSPEEKAATRKRIAEIELLLDETVEVGQVEGNEVEILK